MGPFFQNLPIFNSFDLENKRKKLSHMCTFSASSFAGLWMNAQKKREIPLSDISVRSPLSIHTIMKFDILIAATFFSVHIFFTDFGFFLSVQEQSSFISVIICGFILHTCETKRLLAPEEGCMHDVRVIELHNMVRMSITPNGGKQSDSNPFNVVACIWKLRIFGKIENIRTDFSHIIIDPSYQI